MYLLLRFVVYSIKFDCKYKSFNVLPKDPPRLLRLAADFARFRCRMRAQPCGFSHQHTFISVQGDFSINSEQDFEKNNLNGIFTDLFKKTCI